MNKCAKHTFYHKECDQATEYFIRTCDTRRQGYKLDKQSLQQVEKNRARLQPINKTILCLDLQNITLQGHRNDGLVDDEARPSNNRYFRELLKLPVAITI